VVFDTADGPIHAVRDVSFTLDPGECLAVVGESGSGKSVTARTLVGLVGGRSRISARTLSFHGVELAGLTESQWRAIRGRRIGLVLQDALVSLDPLRTVGAEVGETLRTHKAATRAQTADLVTTLLDRVGIPDPEQRARMYSHQLSGGLRQRLRMPDHLTGAVIDLHIVVIVGYGEPGPRHGQADGNPRRIVDDAILQRVSQCLTVITDDVIFHGTRRRRGRRSRPASLSPRTGSRGCGRRAAGRPTGPRRSALGPGRV